MPEKGYFLKLTGVVLMGAVTLAIAIAAVLLLSPFILPMFATALPFLVGAMLLVVAILVVWALVYIFAMIGVALYYAIMHPAEVNMKSAGYDLKKVKESGMREKKEEE